MHPVIFVLYILLTQEATMCHRNEMFWETYLSDQNNTQTVISWKDIVPRQGFAQNGIDITWNNDQKVKLIKQPMTGIRSFLW